MAELAAAHERAANAELGNLVQRHPELADESNATQLAQRTTEVAADYGLDAGAAGDPRWLALIADHVGPPGSTPHDPEDIIGILDSTPPGRKVLPWG